MKGHLDALENALARIPGKFMENSVNKIDELRTKIDTKRNLWKIEQSLFNDLSIENHEEVIY